MTMTLVETLAEALGHKRTPNSRCLARVAETPPQLRPPGPHNPPMWCCLPQGHDGQHRHNGGGMYPSIPFRDTDAAVMGDPLPDYCEKCRYIWPCPDVQAITAALSAQPAQSVDVETVREVIADLREYGDEALADKLTAALQEKSNG